MTVDEGQRILADNFAPWVLALGLKVVACESGEARLSMPYSPTLVRV